MMISLNGFCKETISIATEKNFKFYESDKLQVCHSLYEKEKWDQSNLVYILNHCPPHYGSYVLLQLNRDLFFNGIKNISLNKNDISRNQSKLNIALLNLLKIKQINSEIKNSDLDQLWDSSKLHFYYAYTLVTSNLKKEKILLFIKKKIIEEEISIRDDFFKINDIVVFCTISNLMNQTDDSKQLEKQSKLLSSFELLPYLYILINSKSLRKDLLNGLNNMKVYIKKENINDRNTFNWMSKSFNKLVFLSYLDKDFELIKKINIKENFVYLNKNSLFLIDKAMSNSFGETYIFGMKNSFFSHFSLYWVPKTLENHSHYLL